MLDTAEDFVTDLTCITHTDESRALLPEKLSQEVLVGVGALLVPLGLVPVETRGEAALAIIVVSPQAFGRIVGYPVLVLEIVYTREGGARYLDPCLILLLSAGLVLLATQTPDQGGQSKALHHECGQDNAEGEEDDQVPLREGLPGVGKQGQGKSRRERDNTAHPGPAQDPDVPRGRVWVA